MKFTNNYSNCFCFARRNWLRIMVILCWAVGGSTVFAKSTDSKIKTLIAQLDSRKFEQRELATDKLVAYGSQALGPVAKQYFSATPEAAWRMKRILEQIGTQSVDEATSLRAIGVLMLIDNQMDRQLSVMRGKWRTNRSERAIKYLVERGASRSWELSPLQRQIMVPRQQVFEMISENPFSPAPPTNPLRNPTRKKLTKAQKKSKINELIESDFEAVQNFVFDQMPDNDENNSELLIQQQRLAQVEFMGIGRGNGNPTLLAFNSQWRGNENDFEKLLEIHSLAGLRFENFNLTVKQAKTLQQLKPIQYLSLSNTKFGGKEISSLALPSGVRSVELEKQKVTPETIEWMANKSIIRLVISDCDFDSKAQAKISTLKNLSFLDLRRCVVDKELFAEMLSMSNLTRIVFTLTKFDPAYYRDFARIRPRVIQFNPISFLGVQGTRDARLAGSYSCQIEMVVGGSAADKAGLVAGDVIREVNGNEIKSFEELRMFISQFDIGEAMKLSVQRGAKTLDLTAVLGDNPNPR